MWLREDLLKSIWHAFTALDVDHRGKVSKSQLKASLASAVFTSPFKLLAVGYSWSCLVPKNIYLEFVRI